jgi:hypothetical protein
MKHSYLDTHSFLCRDSDNCSKHTDDFLFQINGQFFILEYNRCMNVDWNDKREWVQLIINKSPKIIKKYDVISGYRLTEDFKKNRVNFFKKKQNIYQIHSIYSNNAGVEYTVCSKTDVFNRIEFNENFRENTNNALIWVEENSPSTSKEYLKNKIKELFHLNYFDVPQTSIFKTIEEFIKEIKQELNVKTQKHEHSRKD